MVEWYTRSFRERMLSQRLRVQIPLLAHLLLTQLSSRLTNNSIADLSMGSINSLKNKYKPMYDSLRASKNMCPILKEEVNFKNVGWTHFRYDGNGKRRSPANIAMRLNLIPYLLSVITNSTSYSSKTELNKKGKTVTYYELSCEADVSGKKKHVTVVLSRIDNGQLHYFSVRYTPNSKKKNP